VPDGIERDLALLSALHTDRRAPKGIAADFACSRRVGCARQNTAAKARTFETMNHRFTV